MQSISRFQFSVSLCSLLLGSAPGWSRPRVQPYESCVEEQGEQICTQADVGGSTVLGRAYPASLCSDVVNMGRPFFPVPVPHNSRSDDPRLNDPRFMQELAWVTSQIASSACVCCHSTAASGRAAMWDISQDAIWTDQLTPRGAAILSGRLDSGIFGSIPAAQNNGFDRSSTGAPTTDPARMRAYFQAELDRRGVTESDIGKMTPLGGRRPRPAAQP